ncbi:MAG: sodium:solute symporter [Ignavibacteriaceae bacterium]|jgi:SSS family solute:Na+ symporter|nr:sodium:solute symporter [Ignavibacteriaceae bacterium]
MQFNLEAIDIIILILYLVFILWKGFSLAKTHDNAEEYFLAGRSLVWPLVGLSLFASNMSSSSLVGLAGSGYETGISVYSYEWMAAIVLILFAVFFLPFYIRSKVYTMPEFLERRYDAKARYYFSALTIIGNIGIDTAATLYAGALVIQIIFPQIELWQSILALAVLSGLYTIAGGLRAVVMTDAFQAVILVIGSIIITVLAFIKVGSWDAVMNVTPLDHFNIIQPADDKFLPWPGLFTGVLLLGFYFWATNQFIVQRALGAKNIKHGQWGALFAGLLKLTVLFIMVFPGIFARALYPDIEKANLVYPTLLFDLLPPGLLGLVLAGLLAAMMSSIDSALNSASTLVTMDFVYKLKPNITSEKLMWVGRGVTFVFMILSAVWAPQIDKFPTLWEYLQNALSYIAPPIVALYVVGVFWKRANHNGAVAAIVVGIICSVFFFYSANTDWMPQIHFLYVAGILFLICSATIVVTSLLTSPPSEEKIKDYTWSKQIYKTETEELKEIPFYKNYRFHAAALMILLLIVLIIYR